MGIDKGIDIPKNLKCERCGRQFLRISDHWERLVGVTCAICGKVTSIIEVDSDGNEKSYNFHKVAHKLFKEEKDGDTLSK